jgi:hypothetical protein
MVTYFLLREDHFPLTLTLSPIGGISANLREGVIFRWFLIYPIVATAYAGVHANPTRFGANFSNIAASSS